MGNVRKRKPNDIVYITDLMNQCDFEQNTDSVRIQTNESMLYYVDAENKHLYFMGESVLSEFRKENPLIKINYTIRKQQ
tara:strand:+ start:307 stop:543 length:237 start_codon:yes stop_codon:yes gene_type:complete